MHLETDFVDSFHGPNYNNHRDVPIAMPRRRSSTSRLSLTNALAKLLSSPNSVKLTTYPDLYDRSSSLKFESSSFHLHVDDLMRTGKRRSMKRSRGVRFAPYDEITTIMNLDEYSSEEIEACWYTQDELEPRHEEEKKHCGRKKSRRPKKKKRFDCPVCKLLKGDSRWKA